MKIRSAISLLASSWWLAALHASAQEIRLSPSTTMEIEHLRNLRDEAVLKAKEPLLDLEEKYQAAITKIRDQAEASGKVELAEAAEASLQECVDSGTADGEAAHPDLAKAEKTYLEQQQKLAQQIQPFVLKAEKAYVDQLTKMAADLGKTG